jgi:hypothetical protein
MVFASPYNLTWNSIPSGNYSLTAIVTGNDGLITTSPAVNIIVDADTDGDGLGDWRETLYGTNPSLSDGFWIWVGSPNSNAVIP